jgi:DNA-binding NtrC family response regulator
MTARILLVEDEPNMARTLARNLERAGHTVDHAPHGEAALTRLSVSSYDVILTDLKMPVMGGMQLLRSLNAMRSAPAVVVLTGYGTIESAVEAMKLGAADYLIKDARPHEVLLRVEQALKVAALRRENDELRRVIAKQRGFGALIGGSPPMQAIYRLIEAVSQSRATVLLTGESGTGKELVARTIHQQSASRNAPFLAINCAGLSETLLESQLFGHRRGAFTGAHADHDGVFRAADGGTLLLDEIAEVPPPVQAKFLRAIQEREVLPLGANRAVPIDVRLIAATNRTLEDEVRAGRFREDLFYRLNVVAIEIPPLRARAEDITVLTDHFLAEFAAAFGVEPKQVTERARAALGQHPWPGNVRELRNAIERAFAIAQSDTIDLADLPPLTGQRPPTTAPAAAPPLQSLADAEKALILQTLAAAGGNKNEAARLLGIDRQRLYRKIRLYGLG